MPTEWVSFAEVKAAVHMRLVLEHYGVLDRLRPSGQQQYRGCCPIHRGEGRDAFHAHLGKNVFHCFACGAGGNVLDLVAELEQCSTREAAFRIQRRFLAGGTGCLPRRLEPGKDKLVTEKREGNPPLSFSLGGLDPEYPYVSGRGLSRATALRFGIGYYAGPGMMHGRMVIPIHDEHGQLVAYCGRSVTAELPRYRFPGGFRKSAVLFNYHRAAARREDLAIVVEGFFDCMRVDQAGFPSVMALMGCALSPTQENSLVGRFRRIVLMLDGDPAGQAGACAAAERLTVRCSVHRVALAPGMQPDQMSNEEIRQALTQT